MTATVRRIVSSAFTYRPSFINTLVLSDSLRIATLIVSIISVALRASLCLISLSLPLLRSMESFCTLALVVELETLVFYRPRISLRLANKHFRFWYLLHLCRQRLIQSQLHRFLLALQDAPLILYFRCKSKEAQLFLFYYTHVS